MLYMNIAIHLPLKNYCLILIRQVLKLRWLVYLGVIIAVFAFLSFHCYDCIQAKLEEANDLYLSLYAWESENQHKELAKARLPISELLSDQLGVALKLAVKLDPRGTIYVKVWFVWLISCQHAFITIDAFCYFCCSWASKSLQSLKGLVYLVPIYKAYLIERKQDCLFHS